MTRLGASPPTVCQCGHRIDDHHGYCLECTCPIFELDGDR